MRVLFYSTQSYDIESFDLANKDHGFELSYLDAHLNKRTAPLSKGFDAVCVFVNDSVDAEVLRILSENGIEIIALRCAGFNNVDLEAAKKYNIKVVRVPEYSPNAVAEHSCALILTFKEALKNRLSRALCDTYSARSQPFIMDPTRKTSFFSVSLIEKPIRHTIELENLISNSAGSRVLILRVKQLA